MRARVKPGDAGVQSESRLPDSMAVKMLAGFELIHRAAIGALGLPGCGNVQENLGVAVPEFHVRQWAGAKSAPLGVEVFGQKFNACVCHGDDEGTKFRLCLASAHTWDCGRSQCQKRRSGFVL